jgi:hypothetical protein
MSGRAGWAYLSEATFEPPAMNLPPVDPGLRHPPRGLSDRVVLGFVSVLRIVAAPVVARRGRRDVDDKPASVPAVWPHEPLH